MRRAVFLDRDGVINRAIVREGRPYPPPDVKVIEILPGVVDAVKALKSAGFYIIVVTNQPDVARGITPRATVDSIHHFMLQQMPLDRIECCFHDGGDGCQCRKPRPGMLLSAAEALCIDLSRSFMVGDRWRDVEAGQRAGCSTLFIDYGYSEKQPDSPNYIVDSLASAARIILSLEGNNWSTNEKG